MNCKYFPLAIYFPQRFPEELRKRQEAYDKMRHEAIEKERIAMEQRKERAAERYDRAVDRAREQLEEERALIERRFEAHTSRGKITARPITVDKASFYSPSLGR